jgi:membrane-associated phospholipid phosphatase
MALLLVAGLVFPFDIPVARWCKAAGMSGDLMRLLNFSEVFAHGLGVGMLLIAAAVLDRSLTWPWPGLRLVVATFAGGVFVDLLKATVVRVRPRAADLASVASAVDTFSTAALASPPGGHADMMSFPSGHAAVAAGFAAALSWRYPRGAVFFAVVAVLAAIQRVASSAHYPSDVACGAALGLLGAAVFLGDRKSVPSTMESPSGAC